MMWIPDIPQSAVITATVLSACLLLLVLAAMYFALAWEALS